MNLKKPQMLRVIRAFLMAVGLPGSLVFAVLQVKAQQYSVDWSKVAGGGGTSTGGVYTTTGTIGQPDAGTLSGGNFTVASAGG